MLALQTEDAHPVGMFDPREAIRQYVRAVMAETGLDATTLARRVGLAPSTLTRFLNDTRASHTLSTRTLQKLSAYSALPLPMALGGSSDLQAVAPSGASNDKMARASAPRGSVPASGPRDLPILGQARAGMEGFFIENGTVQGYVERPWFLLGRPDAYSCYVSDESMYPVYRHGELLYVDPSRPIGRGDDVVVEFDDGQSFIKRFVRRANGTIICEQFNPPQELPYEADRVKAVHLVVAALKVRA